jgi:hypothetical protein
MITALTPEQEALIPVYREKWRAIAFSTQRIDREKAAEAIKSFYTTIGDKAPERVIFFDSPYGALSNFEQWDNLIGGCKTGAWDYILMANLWSPWETMRECARNFYAFNNFFLQVRRDHEIEWTNLQDQLFWTLKGQLPEEMEMWLWEFNYIKPECLIGHIILASILNYAYNQKTLNVIQSLVNHCGWIFPFEKLAIICDRPTKISFDSQNRLHAEGEPAIQFADGYRLYSYHGETLPEKYGQVHPNQWRSQWLLEEEDAEVRRVLIQGIGYARICQELQATELYNWKEYTLLRIDAVIDQFGEKEKEPIHLLKMTCPSTGHIHVMRLPPEIDSAREAIRWVNGDIDPEEFSVQT